MDVHHDGDFEGVQATLLTLFDSFALPPLLVTESEGGDTFTHCPDLLDDEEE